MLIGDPLRLSSEPRCPNCDALLDEVICVGHADDVLPKPGNVGFCVYCGEVLQFTAGLQLEKCPPEELQKLGAEERAHIEMAQPDIKARRGEQDSKRGEKTQ